MALCFYLDMLCYVLHLPSPPYPTWVVIKLYRLMHIHEDEGLCGPTPTNHYYTINWRPIAYVLWNGLASARYIK